MRQTSSQTKGENDAPMLCRYDCEYCEARPTFWEEGWYEEGEDEEDGMTTEVEEDREM